MQLEVFVDQLKDKVWADPLRVHDPLVLHWLAGLGYSKIMTDTGTPSSGSPLLGANVGIPAQRVDIDHAKKLHTDYWTGHLSLAGLFKELDSNQVELGCPERRQVMPLCISKLQRDLIELFTMQTCKMLPVDWKVGILMNMPKIPLDLNNQEMVQLGMHMYHMDFLHIGLWPFWDDIQVMRPPRAMQVGVGYMYPKPVQVNRFMVVLQASGENLQALQMITDANNGLKLENSSHNFVINWGTLRTDLDYIEKQMQTKPMF